MKIRIMIVDDELTSRNTIKGMLKVSGRYEVAADFSEGKAALEWLRNHEADILLCDIQMPGMSGTELMRMAHVIQELLPIIAISGYANFDYVRGSLVNGASDYLLKHELTREKLLEVLDHVREKYRIEPGVRTVSCRSGYCICDRREFTPERIRSMTEGGEIDFCCKNTLAIAVSPDFQIPERVKASGYRQDICRAIIDIIGQSLGQEYKYLIYYTRDSHLLLILSFVKTISTFYSLNVMKNLTNRISRQSIRMLDTTVTMLTGDLHMEVETSIEEALQMDQMLEDKLYFGGNRIAALAVTKKLPLKRAELSEVSVRKIRFELEHDMEAAVDTVNDLFQAMEEEHYDLYSVREGCRRVLDFLPEFPERELVLKRLGQSELLEQFRSITLEAVRGYLMLARRQKEAYSPMITQVVEYIRKNYNKDISLERCVEAAGSSYSYLSREFKKETGMRFVEYLNRIRVTKAKSLLLTHELPMKEIVEQTGFRNYNYFFKVFKEFEGMTPSEFAAKN